MLNELSCQGVRPTQPPLRKGSDYYSHGGKIKRGEKRVLTIVMHVEWDEVALFPRWRGVCGGYEGERRWGKED